MANPIPAKFPAPMAPLLLNSSEDLMVTVRHTIAADLISYPPPHRRSSPETRDDSENVALRQQLVECYTYLAHFQESEEKYQSFFAAIPDAILLFDRETRLVTETNDAALRLYGYSANEFRKMRVDCLESQAPSFGSAERSKGQPPVLWHRRRDGTCFPVEVLEGDYNWKSRTQGYLICRDITRRRLLEQDGLLARRDWEETFDTIPDAITIHDISRRIVRANRAARELFRVKPEPQAEAPCHLHIHASHCPPQSCLVNEAMAKKAPVKAEFYLDHLKRHYEFHVLPRFDKEGQFTGTIHVVRDVTECRNLEEQLFHSQKMESIGTLAGGVAHDFNNILTVIIGTCALIRMKMGDLGPCQGEIGNIMDAAERAATLTKSLLAFSRKQVFDPKMIDIVFVVRKMESFFRRVIGEDIELAICCPSGQLSLMADPLQLEQVLMNLAVNAKDAMPEGGTLSIGVEPMLVGAQESERLVCPPGEYVVITVRDNGSGMDESTRERIFDPFFTTKEVGKGTGLGLSIVYGVVNQHGGCIRTVSEPGKGTTFSIYLPLRRHRSLPRAKERPGILRGRETILLAEDDATVRETTTAILRECGYVVIPAVDGEDALNAFTMHKDGIDLVVLDVIMPRMNGKKVFDAMRAVAPRVRVLFMSGYTDSIIHRNAIAEDGLEFIAKPASIEALTHKIRELLDVKSQLPVESTT